MQIKDKIRAFTDEYQEQLHKITGKIEEAEKRLDDLSLEIKFVHEVEIPQAVERRVLSGDNSQEVKTKKNLAKLQAEKQKLSEELLVLTHVLEKFKLKQADQVPVLQKLLQDEKRLVSEAAYSKMMAKKKEYEETIQKEAAPLHDLNDLDIALQEIELAAGRRNGVWTQLPVDTASYQADSYRHNKVYLPLSFDEVVKLVRTRS